MGVMRSLIGCMVLTEMATIMWKAQLAFVEMEEGFQSAMMAGMQ